MLIWCKNLFAIFLVALFATGSVLPVVWCVSGTDHSAIEFKIGGSPHHSAPLLIKDIRNLSSLTADNLSEPTGDCLDRDLSPTVTTVVHPDQKYSPTNDNAPKPVLDQQSVNIVELVRAHSIGIPPPFEHGSLQLTHLRTVILLT